jgi:hypothetical protein
MEHEIWRGVKMRKTLILSFVVALILCFSAFSIQNPNTQTSKTEYIQATGNDGISNYGVNFIPTIYGDDPTQIKYSASSLVNSQNTPLISDLNNDGINEIIVLDSATLRIFHKSGNFMETIDAYNIPAQTRYSNPVINDINQDGRKEVLIAGGSASSMNIYSLQYDGYALMLNNTIPVSASVYNGGDILIGCQETEPDCMIFAHDYYTPQASSRLLGAWFNDTFSTTLSSQYQYTSTSTASLTCFPRIKIISISDYDKTNKQTFVLSDINVDTYNGGENPNPGETAQIYYFYHNATALFAGKRIQYNIGNDIFTSLTDCTSTPTINGVLSPIAGVGSIITSPLVNEFDGAISNGYETIMGISSDYNTWRMYYWPSNAVTGTTSPNDEYPEASDAIGTMLSNIWVANILPENKGSNPAVDFCTFGFDYLSSEAELVCGSIQGRWGNFGFESVTFRKAISYNLSADTFNYFILSGSINVGNNVIDGNKMDELILGSYGVYQPIYESDFFSDCYFSADCDMSLIYENPYKNSVLISIDATKKGREDFIAMQTNNLWYISDGYQNMPGKISYFEIDPSPFNVWKQNTSVSVLAKCNDETLNENNDNDLTSARAFIYYGQANEQSVPWSINVSPNTALIWAFNATTLTSSGILRIECRDNVTLTADILELPFAVAENGISYGESAKYVRDIAEEERITAESITDNMTLPISWKTANQQDNAMTTALRSIDVGLNLNFGMTNIWLLIMLLTAFAVMGGSIYITSVGKADINPKIMLGVLLIVEAIEFLLGVGFGYLNWTILIVLVIFGILAGGLWIKSKVEATSGG